MDPDDFVKEFGNKEFESLLSEATPLSEALLDFALQENKVKKDGKISAESKAKIENNLNQKIAEIKDAALKKYFSSFFKERLFYLGSSRKLEQAATKKIYAKPKKNLTDNFAKMALAFLVKFPELVNFRDDIFDLHEMRFFSEKMTALKDEIVENIENGCAEPLLEVRDDKFAQEITEIKNLLASISSGDLELATIKFRILLLKDLLSQVEVQYQESLSSVDEISTHVSSITDSKIKEIFNYKNSLQAMILALEKEII